MKLILLLLLLSFSFVGFSQTNATATGRVTATIIAIEDTSKYIAEQKLITEQELVIDTINIEIGDTKSYLLNTFNPPDEKIILVDDKERWCYDKLYVYITDGVVTFIRLSE